MELQLICAILYKLEKTPQNAGKAAEIRLQEVTEGEPEHCKKSGPPGCDSRHQHAIQIPARGAWMAGLRWIRKVLMGTANTLGAIASCRRDHAPGAGGFPISEHGFRPASCPCTLACMQYVLAKKTASVGKHFWAVMIECSRRGTKRGDAEHARHGFRLECEAGLDFFADHRLRFCQACGAARCNRQNSEANNGRGFEAQ